MYLITDNLQKIIALCKKYKVKALYVFGSILTPRFNDKSDVDFSAIFNHDSDPLVAGENFNRTIPESKTAFALEIL